MCHEKFEPSSIHLACTTMDRCISRRACSDRNSFKLYKDTDGKVELGKYIWTEILCPNVASSAGKTCTDCATKLPKYKYQSSGKCDHGTIGGPYPSDSRLYGSPFYLSQLKDGWKIKEEDETRAKEAQLCCSSMAKKTVKSNDTAAPVVDVVPAEVKPLKKPRKKAVKNTAVAEPSPAIACVEEPPSTPLYVEAMTAAVKVQDVIVIKVKKIRCEGKEYYYNSQSGKVYAVYANGVGPYKGRYDSDEETLNTNYPDSDEECAV